MQITYIRAKLKAAQQIATTRPELAGKMAQWCAYHSARNNARIAPRLLAESITLARKLGVNIQTEKGKENAS